MASLGEALRHAGRKFKDDFTTSVGGGHANQHRNSGPSLGQAIRQSGKKMKDNNGFRERWKNPETRSKWARGLGSLATAFGASPNNPAMMAAERLSTEAKRKQMVDHLRGRGFSVPGAEYLSDNQLQSMILKDANRSAPGAGGRGGGGSKDPVKALKAALNSAYTEALRDGTISPEEQSGLEALKAQMNDANTFLNPTDNSPKPTNNTFLLRKQHLDQLLALGQISNDQYLNALHNIEADVGSFFDEPSASPSPSAGSGTGGNDPLGILD